MLSKLRQTYQWCLRYNNMLFFVGGFLFDALTLNRIDSSLDLLMQAGYLFVITWLLLAEVRVQQGRWQPAGVFAKLWHYQLEAIHFCYGGLLSAYVIFYFKSTTFSRSFIFFGLILGLMFLNEMPQLRKAGAFLRLGLYAFCIISFLNYLFPVLIGQMGWWVFLLAWIASAAFMWGLVQWLVRHSSNPMYDRMRFGWSPAAILVLIFVFYFMKWIPPVPLSVQYVGVYHSVERQGKDYVLTYPEPEWYAFWKKESNPFLARPGDALNVFVRIFAPSRFSHQIFIRWQHQDPKTARWRNTDRIPFPIYGGRNEGYRGHAMKQNYHPGKWRVEVETEDGRAIGALSFTVQPDERVDERFWQEVRM